MFRLTMNQSVPDASGQARPLEQPFNMHLSKPKPLPVIFALSDPSEFAYELRRHCSSKEIEHNQPLTPAEQIFDHMVRLGGRIVGDGFVSVFHEFFTPDSFEAVRTALISVGGNKMHDLLGEAWAIYTKGQNSISLDELRKISPRRFNTKENMDRFQQIGEAIIADMHDQHASGRLWHVEYAKAHCAEFEPIVEA